MGEVETDALVESSIHPSIMVGMQVKTTGQLRETADSNTTIIDISSWTVKAIVV